ncbi:ribonucleases P/MRP protein subunit POP1-like isoform X3 [Camponotus floridanus]|uniref:ribonucleases P/MRP protein subunit POP1-like isoform X3 n=1 Tax=Camponotus floridanus TaxID=104421 RepID=UPI000DC6A9E7|nr:ribonucleases P/MRP protein subunit POP1-like isoform X3 [Camponotus floridanus]
MAESVSNQNLPSTSKQQPSHEKICLETHTWHAKRFHMIDKWGYKIPYYLNDKSHKASNNGETKYCLLQDISYYTCIEIVGEKNWLEAALGEHCNPKKTFAEKMYTNGQREGTIMFFKKNGYPQFPIGYVNFFWKLSETNIKTIWIWVHPAFYSDFLSEIISSFEFKQNNVEQNKTDISHNLNDLYTNNAGCEMRVLKCALNRFRLSRLEAVTVLTEALHVPSVTELDLDLENYPMREEQDSSLNDEKLDTTSTDPRFYLPPRKTETEIPSSAENLRCQLPTDLSRSPIWDAQIRHIVSNSCVSTNTIDKFMDAASISDPHFNKDAVAKIPILLIQKPTEASLGLNYRIDIIIPSRWAMAFWIALITQSPLVGGLRQTKLIIFESLGTYVPDINDPDTPAYMRGASKRKKILTNKYFSHSPNQRVNFIKFGIRSPFFCDWKNLTKGWSDVKDFYVLRHFRLLAYLRNEIESNKRKNARSKSTVQESEFDFQKFDKYKNCLVRVGLSMVSEGTPKEFAIICMPKRKDLRRFQNNKNYDGPVEKYHTDPNENFRKILFKLYLMQMKQLRRDRVELEKTFQDNVLPEEVHSIQDEINRALLLEFRKIISDDFAERIRKWYLPKSTEVRHSCDREVMGYVTIGSYSLLRAKGIGIGYVTLPSLLEIIRKKSNIVLVRNTKDLQYRLARLKILVDINDKY